MSKPVAGTLVVGVGNTLLGDEGVGVHVIRHMEGMDLPAGLELLDGGTGGFLLLGPMQEAGRVVLIDATLDDQPTGTITKLRPKFSSDYPRTLTAHDIGLKDVLDAFYLTGSDPPEVTLFAVTIPEPSGLTLDLSKEIDAIVPEIARQVLEEVD
ncbi:MAG: hydrogenase maturation protease [Acidobacteria bacterium]|uniref:Hydrogenase maturation protease n=1 Tax=Candidatus Polarisedimenticola svalbardensis TaxID=2886004 RepID=A0A8J6XZN4_9BACT|nr:hydrogenase maturation protease [Candidatus Polarisedimenticola svalbardensis]